MQASSRGSQSQSYLHLGLEISLPWGAVLGNAGHLAASLASTHCATVVLPAPLNNKQMPPGTAKCPRGVSPYQLRLTGAK